MENFRGRIFAETLLYMFVCLETEWKKGVAAMTHFTGTSSDFQIST
jgi:hypothetical protein